MNCTFIIPAYNAEKHIEGCMDSVANVAGTIVTDDGSSDRTGEILDRLAFYNLSLLVIHKRNGGVSSARNCGLMIAETRYLSFIDSDDTINQEKFSKCLSMLKADNNLDMVVYGLSFDYYYRDKNFRSLNMAPPFIGKKTRNECIDSINELFESNSLSSLCTRIVKRSVLQGICLQEDMFLYEDLEFSIRLLKNCQYIFFTKDVVYHYRQENGHSNRIRRIKDIHEITDKISDALQAIQCEHSNILVTLGKILNEEKKANMNYAELRRDYPKDANKITIKKLYTKLRHSVADTIKFFVYVIRQRNI